MMRQAVQRLASQSALAEVHTSDEDLVAFGREQWAGRAKTRAAATTAKGCPRGRPGGCCPVERPPSGSSAAPARPTARGCSRRRRPLSLAALRDGGPASSGETRAWPVELDPGGRRVRRGDRPAPGLDPARRRRRAGGGPAAGPRARRHRRDGRRSCSRRPGTDAGFAVNELANAPAQLRALEHGRRRAGQVQQHLRAVLDWPLGATDPVAGAAVMKKRVGGETRTGS
ncbi:hypothetical protein QJS66_08255 [Kocuria rhizophila]|nr:hypothetical protein QJS66_08255 [Kocuria rhizophila]